MDPSIMKLLEEDEDESMHSGADVEAFQAALNRDIGGHASTSLPSDSDSAFSQGKEGNHGPHQSISQWQNASQEENTNFHGLESAQRQEQHSSGMDLKQHGSVAENQQQHNDGCSQSQQKQSQDNCPQGPAEQTPNQIPQTTGIQIAEKNPIQTHEPERMRNQDGESQYSKIQKMSNQPAVSAEQASNAINRGKQVPFTLLLPALTPRLDKDRAMQLHTLHAKLKKNEIVKDVFVRHMRDIVGDQMLRSTLNLIQSQMGANQFQLQSQVAARQQQLRMPSVSAGATQFTDPHSFPQLHQKGTNSSTDPALVPASSASVHGSSFLIKKNSAKKSLELERQPGSHGIHVSQMSSSGPSTANQEREHHSVPVQGLNKQQQLVALVGHRAKKRKYTSKWKSGSILSRSLAPLAPSRISRAVDPPSPREEIDERIGLEKGDVSVGGNPPSTDPLTTLANVVACELTRAMPDARAREGNSSGKPPFSAEDLFAAFSSDLCLFEDSGSSRELRVGSATQRLERYFNTFSMVMSELISHEKEKTSFASQIANLQAQVAKLSIEKANSESELARVTSLLQSAELRAEEAKNESQRLREQCSDQNKAFMQAMKELEPVFQKMN